MHIRRATPDDTATLAQVGAITFRETFGHLYRPQDLQYFLDTTRSSSAFAQLLADPKMGVLLALEPAGTSRPERAIGYAVVGPCKLPVEVLEPGAGELQQLYLLADRQGGGRGTRLLEAALRHLVEVQRRDPLYIGVWSENYGAQRLYGRFGFLKVGEYDFPVGEHLDREFILRRAS